jgi:hypothetical protein
MPRLSNLTAASTSEGLHPTSYSIDNIRLVTFDGTTEYQIKDIVTDFSIIESIYTPALQLSINIKDSVDFMGQARLSGQERIKVQLSKTPYNNNNASGQNTSKIDLQFYVTEYPVYGKQNNLVQAYNVRATSRHAYLSKLIRLSRAFSGKIGDIIKKICIDDLKIPENKLRISETLSRLTLSTG